MTKNAVKSIQRCLLVEEGVVGSKTYGRKYIKRKAFISLACKLHVKGGGTEAVRVFLK